MAITRHWRSILKKYMRFLIRKRVHSRHFWPDIRKEKYIYKKLRTNEERNKEKLEFKNWIILESLNKNKKFKYKFKSLEFSLPITINYTIIIKHRKEIIILEYVQWNRIIPRYISPHIEKNYNFPRDLLSLPICPELIQTNAAFDRILHPAVKLLKRKKNTHTHTLW